MTDEQLELAGATVGLGATISAAMDAAPGFVPCGTPAEVVIGALREAGSAEPPADIAAGIQKVRGLTGHVSEHCGVPAHEGTDVAAVSEAGKGLLDELLGFAAASDAAALGPDDAAWLYRSLAALESGDDARAAELLAETPRG